MGFHPVLTGLIGLYRVLQTSLGFTEFERVLLVSTARSQVFLGFVPCFT